MIADFFIKSRKMADYIGFIYDFDSR